MIEIEGHFNQAILKGRTCSKQQLNQMYRQVKVLSDDTRNVPTIFCRLHHFEQVAYSATTEVDFVIDTDTDTIYSPSY